jgi:hypothetical protein
MTRDTKGNIIYGLAWGAMTALCITAWETWIDHMQFSSHHLLIRLAIFCIVGAVVTPLTRRISNGR